MFEYLFTWYLFLGNNTVHSQLTFSNFQFWRHVRPCLTLYSARREGSSEAPRQKPFNTQVKEILATVGSGEGPSTRSHGANGLTDDGDTSWANLENSDGAPESLELARRDWDRVSRLAIDLWNTMRKTINNFIQTGDKMSSVLWTIVAAFSTSL